MAWAQSEHSSVLQDELTCPVCLDLYRDPLLLPCGHSFCKACLDRLMRQGERGRFRCPECRDNHRCNTKFKKNFKLGNIADDLRHRRRAPDAADAALTPSEMTLLLAWQPGKTVVPCDYCPATAAQAADSSTLGAGSSDGSKQAEEGASASSASGPVVAVKTCLKCEVSMCQEHVKPHLELPAFREHQLTDPINDFWRRKCPDHDEIFRYYCVDDKVCVCNACTVEGGHSGHTIKTLKNTMKDLKGTLSKHLNRAERKFSLTERRLDDQKEKEAQNKKLMDDIDQSLTRLGEQMKEKVPIFIERLRECTKSHCDTNKMTIQRNMIKIRQDQVRLQAVTSSIRVLVQENDPFHFVQVYNTTGKQCSRQLKKTLFYPEYVNMMTDCLETTMEEEMHTFLQDELASNIILAINTLCPLSPLDYDEEQEETVDEEDYEDDFGGSDDDIRTDDDDEEEEDEEEEDEEEEGQAQNDAADDLYSPDEEEEEEEEEDDDEEDGDDDDDDDDDV